MALATVPPGTPRLQGGAPRAAVTVRRIAAETYEEWLEARRTGIGSSDAPKVMGASPFGGALDVYATKVGLVPETTETEAMRWGHRLEAVIAEAVAEKYPERKIGNPERGLFRSEEYPPLIATPDRWIEDPDRGPGLLEIKNVGQWKAGEWDEAEPPLPVMIQVQHQMAVFKAQWATVAALIGGQRLVCIDVERNEEFITKTWIPLALTFWAHVQRREPPVADRVSLEVLKKLYPDVQKQVRVTLPPASTDWHRRFVEAEAATKQWEAIKDAAKNQILQAMGEAEVGVVPETNAEFVRTVVNRAAYHVPAQRYVKFMLKRSRFSMVKGASR